MGLLGLTSMLPGSTGIAAGLAATIGVGQYAKQDAYLLDAHVARGGRKESDWKAAGIGALGMVLVVGVLVVVVAVLDLAGVPIAD